MKELQKNNQKLVTICSIFLLASSLSTTAAANDPLCPEGFINYQKTDHNSQANLVQQQPIILAQSKGRPSGVGGSRPDGVGGSRPDGVGGSRPDGVGGSRPDGVGGSRPDGVGGSRPESVSGSRPRWER